MCIEMYVKVGMKKDGGALEIGLLERSNYNVKPQFLATSIRSIKFVTQKRIGLFW